MDTNAVWVFVLTHDWLAATLFSVAYMGLVVLVGVMGRKHMRAENRRLAAKKGVA